MNKRRFTGISTLVIALLCVAAPPETRADDSASAAAVTTSNAASSPQQIRRAQRKAARAKKKAQLEAERQRLQKNGYQASDQDVDTPKAIQDAQNNAAAKVDAKRKAASGAEVNR
ncbi:hypothetical protein SAMN05192563_1009133 [Paraburkholderia aspalathi]|uniref:DUF4148 domain-containing protein n=2 Tax=Paraburkholderia aspalathi TaxID=1324617 RepID=A0A1I7DC20_9BURK|nr:hypothetical protein SAMN05192563_1009133 [Paraburkholderia aspalathi]